MRGEGKGRRALGAAILLLALTVGAPALSAAQEDGSVPPAPAAVPPAPVAPEEPASPTEPAVDNSKAEPVVEKPKDEPQQAAATEPAAPAAPPPEARVGGQTAQAAASATVSTGDNFFAPASVSVFVGDTVTWSNDGQTQHSATANDGSFDTGIFGPGQSRSQTFDSPGTFSYFCTVHGQSQSGTVTVRAASSDAGGSGGSGSGASGAASGPSEASAVTAPDAAGTATSLPSTGFPALILAAIGTALLWSGIAAGRAADRMEGNGRRRRLHLHSIF